jgi:putative glycosyltransferase (TIGR04372 family)
LYISSHSELGRGKLTIWFFSGTPANSFYAAKLPDFLTMWPPYLAWAPFLVQEALSRAQINDWPEDITPLSTSKTWFNDGFREAQMAALIENLGADSTRPYICLWVRDSSYGEKVSPSSDSWLQSHRDSRLSNYPLLVSRFASEGYSVIRMGVSEIVAGEEFDGTLVDYASSPYRSDANDFLITKFCSFAIVGDSGSIAIPLLYRKPLALVDLGGPYGLFGGRHVKYVTMKTIVWEKTGEPLTMSEILQHRVDRFTERSDFAELGVLHIENSPEDLDGVAVDVLAFLRRRFRRDSPEYQILERKFLKGVQGLEHVFDPRFSPSQKWLLNNPHFTK